MSKAGSKILQGAREALSVAKGEIPAASITVNGHRYVPADRITALEKENAELRKALEPFIRHYEPWMDSWDDDVQASTFPRHTFGDLRRARIASSGRSEG